MLSTLNRDTQCGTLSLLNVRDLAQFAQAGPAALALVQHCTTTLTAETETGIPLLTLLSLPQLQRLERVHVLLKPDEISMLPAWVPLSRVMLVFPPQIVMAEKHVPVTSWRCVWYMDWNSAIVSMNLLGLSQIRIGKGIPQIVVAEGAYTHRIVVLDNVVQPAIQHQLQRFDLGLVDPHKPPSLDNPPLNSLTGNWTISKPTTMQFQGTVSAWIVGILLINSALHRTNSGRLVALLSSPITQLIGKSGNDIYSRQGLYNLGYRTSSFREVQINAKSIMLTTSLDSLFQVTERLESRFAMCCIAWNHILIEQLPWYDTQGQLHMPMV